MPSDACLKAQNHAKVQIHDTRTHSKGVSPRCYLHAVAMEFDEASFIYAWPAGCGCELTGASSEHCCCTGCAPPMPSEEVRLGGTSTASVLSTHTVSAAHRQCLHLTRSSFVVPLPHSLQCFFGLCSPLMLRLSCLSMTRLIASV